MGNIPDPEIGIIVVEKWCYFSWLFKMTNVQVQWPRWDFSERDASHLKAITLPPPTGGPGRVDPDGNEGSNGKMIQSVRNRISSSRIPPFFLPKRSIFLRRISRD